MSDRHRFSILLVDDDAIVVRDLSRILEDFTPIRFASCGSDALRLSRECAPDLVLLDVELPDINGFDLCRQFKSETLLADVPIMFMTSHDSPQVEALGMQVGAVDFISKPPHAPLVVARVRTHYRMKEMSDTLAEAVSMDFLTGTANRERLLRTLHQEWQRARRSGSPLALLLTDVDGVDRYDEHYGASELENSLKVIAHRLRLVVQRPADLLARCGAAKFALLLPETDASGALAVAQRVIREIDAANIEHASSLIAPHITVSVGIGCCDLLHIAGEAGARSSSQRSRTTAEELMTAAEQALETAQHRGGHRAVFVNVATWDSSSVVLPPQ